MEIMMAVMPRADVCEIVAVEDHFGEFDERDYHEEEDRL